MQTQNNQQPLIWAIVPFIGCIQNTKDTIIDLLYQKGVQVNVLAIDNGSDLASWEEIRDWARMVGSVREGMQGKVIAWRHNPPLPSLSATWNAALDFVWGCGGDVAMVCNNDIRMKPWTVAALKGYQEKEGALFVSAVGVTKEQYDALQECPGEDSHHGGPDFSCYLITELGHRKYRFDELMVPAYCEDVDMHRRYMLGGDGARIFSVNVPYLHKDNGSGTLKSFSPERAEQFHRSVAAGSRSYYKAKWGGGANEETFRYPFDNSEGKVSMPCPVRCVTTPELQAHGCRGGRTD